MTILCLHANGFRTVLEYILVKSQPTLKWFKRKPCQVELHRADSVQSRAKAPYVTC